MSTRWTAAERRAAAHQPPPAQGRINVTEAVVADLRARSDEGVVRYGTPLMAFNGRDALVDAYQEALDLACYLRQVLEERDGG